MTTHAAESGLKDLSAHELTDEPPSVVWLWP